jgi:hypothetical protein
MPPNSSVALITNVEVTFFETKFGVPKISPFKLNNNPGGKFPDMMGICYISTSCGF